MTPQQEALPIVAWLVSGGNVFKNAAVLHEGSAIARVEERRDGSRATPLTDHAAATAQLAALQAEVERLRVDAERLEKLGALVACGTWFAAIAGADEDHHMYVDDLPDLRKMLDAQNARVELKHFGQAAIDAALLARKEV